MMAAVATDVIDDEEIESGYVEKKKRGRRRNTTKTSPYANIGSCHADDSPFLAPSSDVAAAAVTSNDNFDSRTGQQYLQYIVPIANYPPAPVDTSAESAVTSINATAPIASHQWQHQQPDPTASATAASMSFFGGGSNDFGQGGSDNALMSISSSTYGGGDNATQHNGSATTNNKRGWYSMSHSSNTSHDKSPFHYLPVAHRPRPSNDNVELLHAGGQQYLHQHYPRHASWTAVSTFTQHDFNNANPYTFDNVYAHGGQHPAQVMGYGMGGIGSMKWPQIVGRSQSLPHGVGNINDHHELNTNEGMMEQMHGREKELKVYHQAQQFGMGGTCAMALHQPVWQPQSISKEIENTNNPFDENWNATMPEMVHSPGPHHQRQQFGVGSTGTKAPPPTVWPPYTDNNDYMNNNRDSSPEHDMVEMIPKEFKATQQPQPQGIHQAGVVPKESLAYEDIELAKFFEAFAEPSQK